MEKKGISVREVDRELWREFRRISRRAGYDRVGELLNDLLLCVVAKFESEPWKIREELDDCKIFKT